MAFGTLLCIDHVRFRLNSTAKTGFTYSLNSTLLSIGQNIITSYSDKDDFVSWEMGYAIFGPSSDQNHLADLQEILHG